MAGKHTLERLIQWSMRGPWADRFDEILADHVLPACDETGLGMEDIVSTIGEDLFMSTVWACAFEDFLTCEFGDGENAIDDYLKRRGWKETASVRTYMAALRSSTMSLYEVSDIVPGTSFHARDLIRGGEPVLISERSATRSLKPWDRIAARVVQVGSKMQVGGGVLVFEHGTAEDILEAWDAFEKLGKDQRRRFAKDALGEDVDDEAIADLSPTEMARTSGSLFTTFWLVDLIDRIREPSIPDWRNSEGDELVLCEVRYPLAAGTTSNDIRTVLHAHAEFCTADMITWNWITGEKPAAAGAGEQPGRSLNFETWRDDGALVLGDVKLEDKAVVLSTNSRQRSDRGDALLSRILGSRVGEPSIKTETVEQIMASRDAGEPQAVDISEEEQFAIIHGQMDRHYRSVLDEPVAVLGGLTPRAAVKTDDGRVKVVEWLKMMENMTAKSGDDNSAMASYDFGWLWRELGLGELRR
ncbi:hypothetical protein [Bradyrhizobium sp. cf659]|uniref:hypothetical protein n=1 Tax=Bradyrhizobium sp. cf659 TaxID=1761771 RepID=UPI0008F3C282|nr:hypothetical protein [Bradyrhizobium sp. cf659]SFJ62757.1 hypothetical protein SAMN04487925_109196 [Bradyrhizobium sp. cf659]